MKYFLYLNLVFLLACESTTTVEDENTITEPQVQEIEDQNVEFDLKLNPVDPFALPDGYDFDGILFDGWYWEDLNGTNYLFRSIEEPRESENPLTDDFEYHDQTLHAYHYLEQRAGEEKVLVRSLTDFIKMCEFDINCSFIEAIELTDLDQDQIGEITFGYRLACRSDVSPSNQKVVLLEDGDKYILRGSSIAMGYGGEFTEGDEFEDANPDFLSQTIAYWNANNVEFE